jgi:hypothetical protein
MYNIYSISRHIYTLNIKSKDYLHYIIILSLSNYIIYNIGLLKSKKNIDYYNILYIFLLYNKMQRRRVTYIIYILIKFYFQRA